MAVYSLDQVTPKVDPTAWVAESAEVMGNVVLEEIGRAHV